MAKQGRKYKQWVVGRYEIPLAAGLWFQPRLVDGSEKPGQETGERERERRGRLAVPGLDRRARARALLVSGLEDGEATGESAGRHCDRVVDRTSPAPCLSLAEEERDETTALPLTPYL